MHQQASEAAALRNQVADRQKWENVLQAELADTQRQLQHRTAALAAYRFDDSAATRQHSAPAAEADFPMPLARTLPVACFAQDTLRCSLQNALAHLGCERLANGTCL